MGSLLDLGDLMDRSLRQLGQLLVVMGALLGAVLGVALALIVENAGTSGAVLGPGRERAAVLAASPPSSRPPVPREASSQGLATGASASQRPKAADQADRGNGKADKNIKDRPDKAGKGKDKPGKGKGTSE